jgi:hypothetical protein
MGMVILCLIEILLVIVKADSLKRSPSFCQFLLRNTMPCRKLLMHPKTIPSLPIPSLINHLLPVITSDRVVTHFPKSLQKTKPQSKPGNHSSQTCKSAIKISSFNPPVLTKKTHPSQTKWSKKSFRNCNSVPILMNQINKNKSTCLYLTITQAEMKIN